MKPIRLLADLRESQADATVPSTPKPGDAHNPRAPLVWEWTQRRSGKHWNGRGTGGGNASHLTAPVVDGSVLGGAWGVSPVASGSVRRVHFNVAFVDLAALIAGHPGFEHFHLREVLIQVDLGNDGLWNKRTAFETWTPHWTTGQVAAASLSATVLLPSNVLYLGVVVEFNGEHHTPSPPLAPVLFAEIPITFDTLNTPPRATNRSTLRPGT